MAAESGSYSGLIKNSNAQSVRLQTIEKQLLLILRYLEEIRQELKSRQSESV